MTIENSSEEDIALTNIGRRSWRRLLSLLANLRLAILLLLTIALFSIAGTVIEQGQSLAFYQGNYPEEPALFGFLSWKILLLLGLDHVYRTWWFLSLLILFGSSLTACTFTRQFPALKAARRWKFYTKPRQFQKLALSAQLDQGNLDSLSQSLETRGYLVFREGDAIYARKGIIGRIGPIIVHASMLIILAGAISGAMGGFLAQEMVASGNTFQVKNIIDAGPFASWQRLKDLSLRVNRFWIDYSPEGGINQFYSDLSVLDNQGEEIDQQTIYVNKPLRYRGVTFYQTDWGIAAVQVQLNNSPIFELPMAQLDTGGRGRVWGTWVPTKPDLSAGVSLLAKDLQGMLLVYNLEGKLISTVRSGMSTKVNGITLKVIDIIGSTGLQIKVDPGIPLVYIGFALLMLGVTASYFSHSQIWALQKGCLEASPEEIGFYVGGKTNRAQVAFEREVIEILEQLGKSEQETPSAKETSLVS